MNWDLYMYWSFCRSFSCKLEVEAKIIEWTPEWNNSTKSQVFDVYNDYCKSCVLKDVSSSPTSNPEAKKITEADDTK